MITCHLRYVIDPSQLQTFEHYGKLWIGLVNRLGGIHHGYLLPSEGANNIALASFSFPSLAAYEVYRTRSQTDPECQAAFKLAEDTRCILSYERSFFRPVFEQSWRTESAGPSTGTVWPYCVRPCPSPLASRVTLHDSPQHRVQAGPDPAGPLRPVNF